MQIDSACRLKLYPNGEQAIRLFRCAGAVRWLWNHLLNLQHQTYAEAGKFVFRFEMQKMLPQLKQEYPW